MGKTISLTIVTEASPLNYGEGFGNVSELKKVNRGDGNTYPVASRQALRFDVVRLGNELFGWNRDTVSKTKGTVQFKDEVTIEDSVEMDLFGYLKTGKKSLKRAAVARLSHAIALEPYTGDFEFLTNMGLAERIGETANLANIENHISYYTYTITIDLSKVGIDVNNEVELEAKAKYERVSQLLDIIKLLSRHIRGRQENLTPKFVIGGLYPMANPFFQGHIKLVGTNLETAALKETMKLTFGGKAVGDFTRMGLTSGTFANDVELREEFDEKVQSVEEFFVETAKQVASYYGVLDEITEN
ncbi:type I-B CRISPR-associated protein Cas7/Cst2/DevR [Kurthia sibirica]|uniref:Type I-B CRISPR-associated protein Cas7/Cst2/DevR n=1 Tax=Kurthia sibirica TaxID=202750 RepID=A0A2U3AIX2_9BACL|nr:type I-B CRISPR-associated protein Cas7/Cst2/DevR [Kurthia sibirica]PWI24480.1 type I-B CRISPR-associated protein Cas7/Cst2/DevR [Kurthia sibirica]GEK35339.1 type I-B CRISPR-associated protein Cas7/Cst2/DevR [Kurthia sibirica]